MVEDDGGEVGGGREEKDKTGLVEEIARKRNKRVRGEKGVKM